MTKDWKSGIAKLARIMPSLFLRDPLLRYAAIAAGIALLFLIAQFGQSLAGPPAVSPAPSASVGAVPGKPQSSAATPAAAAGGSPATPLPAQAPAFAPGRPLNGVAVEPAPVDTFGRLPKGAKAP